MADGLGWKRIYHAPRCTMLGGWEDLPVHRSAKIRYKAKRSWERYLARPDSCNTGLLHVGEIGRFEDFRFIQGDPTDWLQSYSRRGR